MMIVCLSHFKQSFVYILAIYFVKNKFSQGIWQMHIDK